MTRNHEDEEFDFIQAECFFGEGSRKAGMIIETKNGVPGRTYSHQELVRGKVRVYTNEGKLLCSPESLVLKGFID